MSTPEYLQEFVETIDKTLLHFQEELKNVKTGRATPSLVENIQIETYGALMPLIQLAAISAPEPNLLLVKPWDKTNIKPISQVLQAADLGATVGVDDDLLRIRFSPLTEERRLELVKKLKEKTETTKVKIRGLRDKIREATVKAGADGEISEDEKYRRLEEIDKGTKEANEKIKTIADKKEAEIMSI